MDQICAHVEAVLCNEIPDLVINVPPGTSKSTLMSVLFPVYCWITDPTLKLMFTSYDESLTLDFARRSLELINSPWFQARWPEVKIRNGERANHSVYETSKGGKRISTMMGGKATGRHCHILVVDDPHKPDDLDGAPDTVKAALDLAWSRWINTFSQRVADESRFRRICIMQRLHEGDIAGRMLLLPTTVHLCLPMEFESKRACRTRWGGDWRTVDGELLCPKRKPQAFVDKKKAEMTARAYAAQHQQRPAPAEGALFKREQFQNRWVLLPGGLRKFILSIDSNLKDRADCDYCVMQVWAVLGPDFYLIDEIRGQWTFSQCVKEAKTMRRKWPQIGNVVIENKANGTAIIDTLKKTMRGVIDVDPLGGKLARAEAVEYLLRAGNCVFPPYAWVDDFVEECVTFPVGTFDDRVDAMSQALLFYLGKYDKQQLRKQAMRNVRSGAAGRLFRLTAVR